MVTVAILAREIACCVCMITVFCRLIMVANNSLIVTNRKLLELLGMSSISPNHIENCDLTELSFCSLFNIIKLIILMSANTLMFRSTTLLLLFIKSKILFPFFMSILDS